MLTPVILVVLFSPFLWCRLDIPAVTAAEALIFLAFFAALFRDIKRGGLSLRTDILDFSLAIFLLFTSAQILSGATMYPYATQWGLIRALSSILLFLLIKNYLHRDDIYRLIKAAVFAAAIASVMAIAQKIKDPSAEHYAFFLNRNHFAGYLELNFGLALGAFLYRLRRFRPGEGPFFLIAAALTGFSIFMTASRAGTAVFLVSTLFFFAVLGRSKRAYLALFIAIAIALLALWVFYEPLAVRFAQIREGIEIRMKIYASILRLIRDYPLWGTGFNTFEYAFARYQPSVVFKRLNYGDNDYLQFISEVGLPVAVVIFAAALGFFVKSCRIIRKTDDRFVRFIGCGALAAVFAIGLHSLVDFNLRIHSNAILFFVCAGVLAAVTANRASPPARCKCVIFYILAASLFIILFTVSLLENAAFYLSKRTDFDSAEAAAKISPLNSEYRYLASQRAPDLKTALIYAHEASGLNPLYHKYKHNLARIYYSLRTYDKAEEYYKKYVELDPWNAYSYVNFALYYFNRAAMARGAMESEAFLNKGASLFRKAKSLNPNVALSAYKEYIPVYEDVYNVLGGDN